MKIRQVILLLLATTGLAAIPLKAKSQSLVDSEDSSTSVVMSASATHTLPDMTYIRPTQKPKLRNYAFDAFGPYPIVGAALAAGINQAKNAPREWKQGAEGYGKRFASNFGIAAVSTTTRYALARAFREDTLYSPCACKGVFPRLSHAVISTITARRGDEGHRVLSFPALVAPYAGTMTAVYAWYPGRYNAMDGFRMGNYALLGSLGEKIAMEFLYNGPHSLLSRMHLNKANGHEEQSLGTQP